VIPAVIVDGLAAGRQIAGDTPLHVAVAADPPVSMVGGFEFFVDGKRIGTCGRSGEFLLSVDNLDEGHHELRVVAVTGGALETRGLEVVPFRYVRTGADVLAELVTEGPIMLGDPVILRAQLDRAERTDFHHNGRLLASIEGDRGEVHIDSNTLGPGPVTIRPIGSIADRNQSVRSVRGRSIDMQILRPAYPPHAPASQGRATTQDTPAPPETDPADERAGNGPVPVPGDPSDE